MTPGSPLLIALSAAGGFFGDQFIGINSMIDGRLPGSITTPAVPASGTTAAIPAKSTPTATMNNVVMGGELGLGALLVMSKGKSMIKTVAGGALLGLGARRLLKEMGMISGFQDYSVIGRRRMNGFQDYSVIGKMPASLAGMPNALSGGYEPAGMGGYNPLYTGSRVMGSMDGGSGLTDR